MLEIQDLSAETMEVYLCCGCSPMDARITDGIRAAQGKKRAWAEGMLARGLGAKLAFDGSYPAGFVEFLPIEVVPEPVLGKDLLFISDIHINDDDLDGKVNYERRGIGRMLVEEVERTAREREYAGLVTLALEGDWMPAAFFEKTGFTMVESTGPMRLLWKPFRTCKPPAIWKGNFIPSVGEGCVHLELIYNSLCWGMAMQAEDWRRAAAEFGEKVVLLEHLVDNRQTMSLDCMTGSMGVYIDGQWGPPYPIDYEQMGELLSGAVARRTGEVTAG